MTHSDPLGEGLTKQWPGTGCTHKCSQDHAAINAQRLWLGTTLPQKKFTQSCSSSVSGVMENHNIHLALGFTLNDLVPAPVNVVVLWSLLGPGGCTASTKCPSSRGTTFPMWPKYPQTSLYFWGFTFLTRALLGIELWSFRLCSHLIVES